MCIGTEASSSSREKSEHGSYFAYDADGQGSVGYVGEHSRRKVAMVPPQRHCASTKDDVFSIGCIMAAVFTGQPLFSLNSLKKHLLGMDVISGALCRLPPALSREIREMVHRDPSKRPSVAQVLSSNGDALFVPGLAQMMRLIAHIHECKAKGHTNTVALLAHITAAMKRFSEMHPELFALLVPYLLDDVPLTRTVAYFRMLWCAASKLSEELCCYLLKRP